MLRRFEGLAAAAAVLAIGMALPGGLADVATGQSQSVPKPQKSLSVAGYRQTGCHQQGFPVYVELTGTIKVPAATDVNGTPGISYDIYSFGGLGTGVAGGVAVDNSGGQAFYTAFGEWHGKPVTAFQVQPGDKLQVTIQDKGPNGYLVEIFDAATKQEFAQTNPDSSATRCKVAAYEESPYPAYDHTTKTSQIVFSVSRVSWGERGQAKASVTKLLGKPPAHATLTRYNLVNTHKSAVANTSAPASQDNNFTITDK